MLKLYNFHASSTSYRTRIVLNLKGLAYEYIPIRLDKAEHLGAAYGAINPMRGVPTLEVDGARIYQSGAIIEYLEEVYPAPPLLPKDPLGRAQVRAIAGIVGADMHAVNNLRIRKFIAETYGQTPEGVAAWIGLWNKAGFEAIEAMLRADKKRRGFCYGSTPTIADAYLVSHVFSAVRFKTDMSPYAEIRAVVEKCNALKPFADAHPSKQPDAEGAIRQAGAAMSDSKPSEPPPAAAGERRKPRKKTYIRGLAVTLDGTRTIDCRLEDVSESGAKVSLNKGRALPERFYLLITGREFAYETVIVWTRPHECGLKYVNTLSVNDLRQPEWEFLRRLKLERLRA